MELSKRETLFYLTAVRDITEAFCLIESAYKATGFLKGKNRSRFFFIFYFLRVLLANSCFSQLISLFSLKQHVLCVNLDFILSPIKY